MRTHEKQTLCMALLGAVMLGGCTTGKLPKYDARPDNRPPGQMTRAGSPYYNIENEHTFPVFKDPYTVAMPRGRVLFGGNLYELYRAKEATYVTATYGCPADWWFYHFNSETAIIDNKTGDRYMLREVEYYPTDTCFWINGSKGKNIRFVMVFPPLPKKVKTVDFFIPSSPSRHNFDGSAKRERGLSVKDLRPESALPAGQVFL